MHASGSRRPGLPVLSRRSAVLLAVSAGLAAASAGVDADPAAAADADPAAAVDPDPVAAKPRCSDPLQQQVNAIHGTGPVGVLAQVTSRDERRSARAGTAVLGTGRPVPSHGRFRIGSATKTFTATVVLQLVGEGRMSLDDTVEHWLPGVVRGHGNKGSQVTVRQLLQHTSGIPDVQADIPALTSAAGFRAERLRTYSPDETVALAMRHAPTFRPGTDWSYSNTNYVLAGMVVERVTGRSWAQEVNARIIHPLRLAGTSTPGTDPSVRGPHAHGYAAFDTGTARGGRRIDVTEFNPSVLYASGSVISTAYDLSRFYIALLGGRLLAPAQLDAMTTTVPAPELGVPGARYGLGLGQLPLSCGGSYFAHFGEAPGYHTWGGVTGDGTRAAVVSVTGDGDERTQQAMSALVDHELCGTGS